MQPGIVLWPNPISLSGYETLFKQIDIIRPLLNNTYVAVVGTLLHVMLAAITAYALVRRPFPGRRFFILLLLVTMMIPMENIMIPIYVVYKDLGLLNTLNSIVLSGAVSGFSVLLLKNFFEGIPGELAESAEIDGANDLRIFAQIFLPLSLAGLATVTLFQFVSKWNNFFEAVLFLSDTSKYTLQIALKNLIINSDITSTTDSVVEECPDGRRGYFRHPVAHPLSFPAALLHKRNHAGRRERISRPWTSYSKPIFTSTLVIPTIATACSRRSMQRWHGNSATAPSASATIITT